MLLDTIPDEGLPETLETLHKIREFYSEPVQPGLIQEPTTTRVPVRVRHTYVRPAFTLDFEEE
jgi:hypothetical protein